MAADDRTQEEPAPVLTATEARQGRRGRHMLWVLGVSMGLIVAIYAVMVLGVQGSRLSLPGGQTSVDQKALQQSGNGQAPPPQARQAEKSPTVSPSVQPPAGKEQTPRSAD